MADSYQGIAYSDAVTAAELRPASGGAFEL
jgi:hypothetical protein